MRARVYTSALPCYAYGSVEEAKDIPSSPTQIDALLAHFAQARLRLLTARNALRPICRLPPEVLSIIFIFLLPVPESTFCAPSTKDLRAASQTCTHLRSIALSCPTLWTSPETLRVHPHWTACMLSRSSRALLHFRTRLFSPRPEHVDACRLVLAHTDRLESVHVEGDASALTRLMDPVMWGAPRLRELVLESKGWKAEPARLGASFLQGGAPSLEKVELRRCVLPWDAGVWKSCAGLRHLVVEGTGSEEDKTTLAGAVGALRGLKALRTLRLEGLHRAPSLDEGEIESVELSELEELFLSGPTGDAASLLAHLTLPPEARVELKCTSTARSDDIPAICGALSSLHTSSRPIRSLHLTASAAQLSLHTSPSPSSSHGDGSTSLTLTTDSLHPHTLSFLNALLHALPLRRVTSLMLDDKDEFLDVPTCGALLALLPCLRTLHLKRSATPTVLSSLSQQCASGTELPAPRLSTLIIEESDLGWSYDALYDAQLFRSYHDAPIHGLQVVHCMDFGELEVKELGEVFVEVAWDGFEAYVTEGEDGHEEEEEEEEGPYIMWDDYWEYEGVGARWHS